MELQYIRIKGYKGLSDLDLNFSNRFRFHYNSKETSLEIAKTENYIESFFAINISNFTGIIGQNGTGKTSVLRYVMQYFGSGNNEHDESCVAIFSDKNKLYYYAPTQTNVINLVKSCSIQKIKNLDDFKDSTSLVFVSNHFDPTSFHSYDSLKEELGDTKNLSTNYLLSKDIQKRRSFKDSKIENLPFKDHISAFSAQEFIRIVKLLRWINSKRDRNPFPAELPPYINLNLYYNEDSPNNDKYIKLRDELKGYFNVTRKKRDQFLINAFEAGIFHLIDEGSFSLNSNIGGIIQNTSDKIIEFVKKSTTKKVDQTILSKITEIINYLKKDAEWKVINAKFESLNDFIVELNTYLDKYDGRLNPNSTSLSIKISQATIGSLISLVDSFYVAEKIGDYAEFYFSHSPLGESSLSSGEYSLLSLFGRLNDFKFDRGKKDFLFLIDEAELALHPEWQRRFVDVFTDFMSEKFSNYKIQILLTSHSPFILSDLPPHCVILLRKDGDENRISIDSLENNRETFGANIHELFTDSFFLRDGLIGEFAKNKINDLINDIKEEQQLITSEIYDGKYKRRIDIIGEPFLRSKILELMAKKSAVSIVDALIAEKNREIELLNLIKFDKENDQDR